MAEGRPVSGSEVGGSATPQPPTVDNSESAAISRALVELGLLLIRRRPITPPISGCPLCANVPETPTPIEFSVEGGEAEDHGVA